MQAIIGKNIKYRMDGTDWWTLQHTGNQNRNEKRYDKGDEDEENDKRNERKKEIWLHASVEYKAFPCFMHKKWPIEQDGVGARAGDDSKKEKCIMEPFMATWKVTKGK